MSKWKDGIAYVIVPKNQMCELFVNASTSRSTNDVRRSSKRCLIKVKEPIPESLWNYSFYTKEQIAKVMLEDEWSIPNHSTATDGCLNIAFLSASISSVLASIGYIVYKIL